MTGIRSKIAKLLTITAIALAPTVAPQKTLACTGIEFDLTMEGVGNSNYVFAGRTMEFGPDVTDWKMIYVPKHFEYQSCRLTSVDNSILDTCGRDNTEEKNKIKGYTWKVKHSYVGFTPMKLLKKPGSQGEKFEYTLTEINDGINEAGLYCGGLYHMTFEEYSTVPYTDGQKNLTDMDFVAWVLGRFSSVKELKDKLTKSFELEPIHVRQFDVDLYKHPIDKNKVPQIHYHVVDNTGDAVVIEFVGGKPRLFTSVGVITNDPTYDWHTTNLRNYVGLQAKNHMSTKFMGVTYKQLSNGTGGIGLPGDFTSTSRFIRAMYLLNATVTNNTIRTPEEAVFRAFRVLNQFDIPEGSVVETKSYDTNIVTTKEATSWTSMSDLRNLRYYYHTMMNRTIRMIELDKLKKLSTTTPVLIELPQNELIINETPKFK